MLQYLQGGDDWQSGHKKQILALGATEVPIAGRARQGTPLEAARAALALSAQPKSMPGREQERAEILRFVEEAVAAGEAHYDRSAVCLRQLAMPLEQVC